MKLAWEFQSPPPQPPWYRRCWTALDTWLATWWPRIVDWMFKRPLGMLAIWAFIFHGSIRMPFDPTEPLWQRLIVIPGLFVVTLAIILWSMLVYIRLRYGKEQYERAFLEEHNDRSE